jgi:hypothetical protein
MSRKFSRFYSGVLALLFVISSQSCNAPQANIDTTQPPVQVDVTPIPFTPSPSLGSPAINATATLAASENTQTVPSATAKVRITVAGGNLFIRRGPDMAYNPLGILEEGNSVDGLARDVLAEWVEVAIPSQPGRTGWISIQTEYSVVDGDVDDLPMKTITDWPVPAYVRNCTYHSMVLEPGDIVIPSYLFHPEHEVWVNPGIYKAYDMDMDGYPEIMDIRLSEGSEVEILLNGDGERRKCP